MAPKTRKATNGDDATFANVTITGTLGVTGLITSASNYLAVSADGAIAIPSGNRIYFITKGTAAAITLADPTTGAPSAGGHDGVVLTFVSTTAAAHTVSNAAGSGFFSSGGASKDVGTFGGAIGDGFACIAYLGKWYIDPRGVTNVTLG
jgi:hypothetical protein